ncbi:MAG: hypothetical protein ACQESU_07630 [Halobacteriota archaeon]
MSADTGYKMMADNAQGAYFVASAFLKTYLLSELVDHSILHVRSHEQTGTADHSGNLI